MVHTQMWVYGEMQSQNAPRSCTEAMSPLRSRQAFTASWGKSGRAATLHRQALGTITLAASRFCMPGHAVSTIVPNHCGERGCSRKKGVDRA